MLGALGVMRFEIVSLVLVLFSEVCPHPPLTSCESPPRTATCSVKFLSDHTHFPGLSVSYRLLPTTSSSLCPLLRSDLTIGVLKTDLGQAT